MNNAPGRWPSSIGISQMHVSRLLRRAGIVTRSTREDALVGAGRS
jgi:hypothetical protein